MPAKLILRRRCCLAQWANAHVDQCCLRFVRNYIRDKHTHYVFGQLNSDEEYNGRSLALSIQNRHDAGCITDQVMKVPLPCGRGRSFAEGLS